MNTPNYYAIIPADVRYNKNLTFLEKFLYCEITALSNINGYCFASNNYFSNLYNKSPETISRALKNLVNENHILMNYERKGTKVTNRKIYPLTQKQANDIFVNGKESTVDIFVNGEHQKLLNAIDKKVKDNNITYLDIFNIITNIGDSHIKKKVNAEEDIEEIINYLNQLAGTNFKSTTKATVSLIAARMKESFTIQDFKTVIEKKCVEWKNTDYEQYLRPTTLFGTKFEQYLNQLMPQKSKQQQKEENKQQVKEYFESNEQPQYNSVEEMIMARMKGEENNGNNGRSENVIEVKHSDL